MIAALGIVGCESGQSGPVDLTPATFFVDQELEGGCAWVEAEDGTNYEVTWPDGFEVDIDQRALIAPDGRIAAEHGDTIKVGGRVNPDVGTICQVGTVLDADTVVTDP